MGRSCDRRWTEIILSELESDSAPMRYEAALACGELWLRTALPHLARLLDDPDREVRDATIWALGQIGGAEARELLFAAYDDADESTRLSLDEALAEEAFVAGDLDFLLYEMEEDLEDEATDDDDDELYALWTADDSDPDEPDVERW
jgi:HEAT repeat protein